MHCVSRLITTLMKGKIIRAVLCAPLLGSYAAECAWGQVDADRFKTIFYFDYFSNGYKQYPKGGVVFGDGAIYGTTSVSPTVFELMPPLSDRKTWAGRILYNFDGKLGGFAQLEQPLTYKNGIIFGVSRLGGDPSCSCGIVYKLTRSGKDWRYKLLHAFSEDKGAYPKSRILLADDGTLYGTTVYSGKNKSGGTVYKITAAGDFSVLHDFRGDNLGSPISDLVFGKDGAIYGNTDLVRSSEGYRGGSAYRISTSGSFAKIYTFNGSAGFGSRAVGDDGTIYGTASNRAPGKHDYMYSLKPGPNNSWSFKVIYSFNIEKRAATYAGIIRDSSGLLYGTGVLSDGRTVLYRLSPANSGSIWQFTTLHTFDQDRQPLLSQFQDGILYGTQLRDGPNYGGSVFTYKLD